MECIAHQPLIKSDLSSKKKEQQYLFTLFAVISISYLDSLALGFIITLCKTCYIYIGEVCTTVADYCSNVKDPL